MNAEPKTANNSTHRTTRQRWIFAFRVALLVETPLFLLTIIKCWDKCDRGLQPMHTIVYLFVIQLPGSFLAVLADGGITLGARAITGNPNALPYFSSAEFYPLVYIAQTIFLSSVIAAYCKRKHMR